MVLQHPDTDTRACAPLSHSSTLLSRTSPAPPAYDCRNPWYVSEPQPGTSEAVYPCSSPHCVSVMADSAVASAAVAESAASAASIAARVVVRNASTNVAAEESMAVALVLPTAAARKAAAAV